MHLNKCYFVWVLGLLVVFLLLFEVLIFQNLQISRPKPTISFIRNPVQSAQNTNSTNIFITLGLCWSATTKYHGKQNFPYVHAAELSSQLWTNIAGVSVILQIVYTESVPTKELLNYQTKLKSLGIKVFLITARGMDCVLKAQLIRLLAYNYPFVRKDDILITSDVDAFIMTKNIIKPILTYPDRLMWIYRYELTVVNGYTFMMPFIGARAKVWNDILEYPNDFDEQIGNNLEAMILQYSTYMNITSATYKWDFDQKITTYAILKSGVCSLPSTNQVWKDLKLRPM